MIKTKQSMIHTGSMCSDSLHFTENSSARHIINYHSNICGSIAFKKQRACNLDVNLLRSKFIHVHEVE